MKTSLKIFYLLLISSLIVLVPTVAFSAPGDYGQNDDGDSNPYPLETQPEETEDNAEEVSVSDAVKATTFLTDDPNSELFPVWTTDGRYILYALEREDENNREFYRMKADGTEKERIWIGEGDLIGFSDVSPDGTELLSIKYNGNRYDLYKVDINKGNSTPLAADYMKSETGGYWSPDGKKIIYSEAEGRNPFQLWVMDKDGNNKKQLGTSYHVGIGKDWSPDGSKIIYSARDWEEKPDLWLIDPEGINQTRLTDTPYGEWNPAFDPEGKYIVYVSDEDGDPELWLRDISGNYKVKLTENIGVKETYPQWSPDGKKILFVGHNSEINRADIAEIELGPKNETPESLVIKILEPSGDFSFVQGREERIKVKVTDSLGNMIAGPNGSVEAEVGTENPVKFQLADDGSEGDETASDGVYTYKWVPPVDLAEGPEKLCTIRVTAKSPHLPSAQAEVSGKIYSQGLFSDLAIEAISWEPQNPAPGNQVNLTLSVKNKGPAAAGSFWLECYINESLIGNFQIPELGAGETSNTAFTWTPNSNGNAIIKAVANANNDVQEKDKQNNEKTEVIVIGSSPVYGTLNITILPASLRDKANWTIITPRTDTEWHASGETLSNISAGNYTISFSEVNGWRKPNNISVTINGNSVNRTGTYTVIPARSSRSSSSGERMGAGGMGSPESIKNISGKDQDEQYFISGIHIRYEFKKNITCIQYVELDPKRTFTGKINVLVEMLKRKSGLISELPKEPVYRNVNIWMGKDGMATSKNIENGLVGFKVDKVWIDQKIINESSIILQRYNNGEWEKLPTQKVGDDENYTYFEAKTDNFSSSFAITGMRNTGIASNGTAMMDINNEMTTDKNFSEDVEITEEEQSKKKLTNIMAISLTLVVALLGYMTTRKREK